MMDLYTGSYECILNWNSPKQVTDLFNDYGIVTTVHEQGIEKQSIDSKVLDPQKDKFEIIPLYLKYKKLQKVVSTYGLGWAKFINPVTGRIHTTFQQLMDTGYLSSHIAA
jgi:DNA polymerase-1